MRAAHDVEILYSWGVDGCNRVDTRSGTATRDCIPPITGPLELTDEERASVLALADSVDFWSLPSEIRLPEPNVSFDNEGRQVLTGSARTPCSKYLLSITRGRRTHVSRWTDCCLDPCPERERAQIVGRRIRSIIESKKAWERLRQSCRRRPAYM